MSRNRVKRMKKKQKKSKTTHTEAIGNFVATIASLRLFEASKKCKQKLVFQSRPMWNRFSTLKFNESLIWLWICELEFLKQTGIQDVFLCIWCFKAGVYLKHEATLRSTTLAR